MTGNELPKVVFTTPVLGYPPAGGPELRIDNSIKALHRVCELHLVSRVSKFNIGRCEAETHYRALCKKFTYVPFSRIYFRRTLPRKVATLTHVLIQKLLDMECRYLVNLVRKECIRIMWFGYGNISFPLIKRIKAKLPSLKVVCDTDSVWSRFILRELPFEKNPVKIYEIRNKGRQKQQEELEWVDLCDVTTAVSEVDADYYRKIATSSTKVKIFSNAIDLSFYSKAPPPPLGFCRPAVFLGGSFAPGSAMDKAARWVLTEIFPSLMKLIPGIHLYIVGRGSRETLREYNSMEGVTITGRVPFVLPYLCNSDVSIVPLLFESGTRFKILEAGACGIPSVSTTLGAEGLPVTHQKDILIADTATDFIQAVMGILTNPELSQKLSLNCRALVKRKFGIESLAREASEIIEYLITPRHSAAGNL